MQQKIGREMQQQLWQNRLMCRSASTTSRRRSNIYLFAMADGSSMGCRASKVFGEVCNVLRDQDFSTFPARLAIGRLCRWMDRPRRRSRSRTTGAASKNALLGAVSTRGRTPGVGCRGWVRRCHRGGFGGVSAIPRDFAGLFASNAGSGALASRRPCRPAFIRSCRPDGFGLAGAGRRAIRLGGLGYCSPQPRQSGKDLRVLFRDLWSSETRWLLPEL
jgi:hypothetical protein